MKVAILQCDNLLEKLQPKFGEFKDMIQQMFSDFEDSFSFDVFDCRKQEYPSDIFSYDFFITTGSRASAYDEEPWILSLIDFVKKLDHFEKKLIGICFGHQLIAVALHGQVRKSSNGWGVGLATNRVVSTPNWMQQKVSQLKILVSHQDQVISLANGAKVLAESDFCPYFIIQWNNHFLSIQGHPEWNRDYSRALMHERRAVIPEDRIEEGLSTLRMIPDNQIFAQWVVDFVSGETTVQGNTIC